MPVPEPQLAPGLRVSLKTAIVKPRAAPRAETSREPHGSEPLKLRTSAAVASVSTGVPFCTLDGSAQKLDARATSLRRSASDHSRMTLIAAGSPARVARSGTSGGIAPGCCACGAGASAGGGVAAGC